MNPLEALIQQLTAQAGSRGAMFAGRHIARGESPNLLELLSRPAQEAPDAEGMGAAISLATGSGILGKQGTQEILSEYTERMIKERARSDLKEFASRKAKGWRDPLNVADEEYIRNLSTGKESYTPSSKTFRFLAEFDKKADPKQPITNIMSSGWFDKMNMHERAAFTKLADVRGELDRLFLPEHLARIRNWYNSLIPPSDVQEVLTRHLRPKK